MQLSRQGWVTKMVILGQLGHYMLPSPPFTLKKKSINWYYTWKSGSSASLICDCVANLPTSTKYIWGFPTVTGRGSMLVHRWLKMHLKKNAWGSYFRSCKLIERPRRLGTFFVLAKLTGAKNIGRRGPFSLFDVEFCIIDLHLRQFFCTSLGLWCCVWIIWEWKNGSHRKTRCSVVFAEGCVSIPTVVLVLECLATTKAKFLCCWVWAFLEIGGFSWRTYRTDFSICFCAKQLLPGGRICIKSHQLLVERTWNSRSEFSESLRVLISDFHEKTLVADLPTVIIVQADGSPKKRRAWQPNTHFDMHKATATNRQNWKDIRRFQGAVPALFVMQNRITQGSPMDFPSED